MDLPLSQGRSEFGPSVEVDPRHVRPPRNLQSARSANANIEDLALWENTTNEAVLQRARDEIWQSWRRACAANADHPRARELFDRHNLPAFHDPFAGGGTLPLEAQRLGLDSHASDLNPVAC